MKRLLIASLTLLSAALTCTVFAAPEATVLFAQPGTIIIDAEGVSRSVKRGDVVQTGERLSTPPGGISQLKLLDGSLLGVRPDSEVKMMPPPPATDKSLQVVSLTKGALHVLSAELMDAKKPSRFTLHSGSATLKLQGADLESSVARPSTGPKPINGADTGSYNRMMVGNGSIESGGKVVLLKPKEMFFVGEKADAQPENLDPSVLPFVVPSFAYNKVVLTIPKVQQRTPICSVVRRQVVCT